MLPFSMIVVSLAHRQKKYHHFSPSLFLSSSSSCSLFRFQIATPLLLWLHYTLRYRAVIFVVVGGGVVVCFGFAFDLSECYCCFLYYILNGLLLLLLLSLLLMVTQSKSERSIHLSRSVLHKNIR